MNVNSRKRLILSALVVAGFMLMSQSAQAGPQVSAGGSLWMRTSLPAPGDFEAMTFFWRPSSDAGVTFQYVVYRPAGRYGQVLHPRGMDLEPFKNDSVIVEFRVLEGSVEFLDPVGVWDGWRAGGKQEWVPYTFFFGFYLGRYPDSSVVDYVPGEILQGEPPHGDPMVVYPMTITQGQDDFRSDFLEAMEVSLDIKPLSCPNPVNTTSRGTIPVALPGTAGLDVRTVDLATIRLEGVAPVRAAYSDVAAPFDPDGRSVGCRRCAILGDDGFEDLVLHFDTQAVGEYLRRTGPEECRVLVLTGQKTDGTRFVARDVVKIVR